jgi:hypothetical protein
MMYQDPNTLGLRAHSSEHGQQRLHRDSLAALKADPTAAQVDEAIKEQLQE